MTGSTGWVLVDASKYEAEYRLGQQKKVNWLITDPNGSAGVHWIQRTIAVSIIFFNQKAGRAAAEMSNFRTRADALFLLVRVGGQT
ncbi:hypothetical protein BpHYR1_026899 [Brachionus plicatilis]|uniref:Uncharacterized protein n=1 Tax=Brachionus plicatilis TaxID=10195 RepID=A0A3M7Q685_BRAPC|nr:hypothetical protein BpHYR1_026899 [Brachionus plicatilis]